MCSAAANARPPRTSMAAARAMVRQAAVLCLISVQPDELGEHTADGLEGADNVGERGLVVVACLAVVPVAPGSAVDAVPTDAPASGGVAVVSVPEAGNQGCHAGGGEQHGADA